MLSVLLSVSVLSLYGYMTDVTATAVQGDVANVTKVSLPIVMYHHVLKDQSRLNKYTISPAELRQDFEYIRENGYTPISMKQLIAYTEGAELPERPIIITFDDGHESFHEYAYPLLKEYGYKAVLSVVGTYVDQYSEKEDHHISYSHCNWQQLKEMQDSGLVEVENHSYNLHVNKDGRHGAKKKQGENLSNYRKVLLEDIGKMQEECYEYLGEYPDTFTYPFGQISKEASPIIRELGFKAMLICQERFNCLTGDPEELYHLNRFNRAHNDSLKSIIERATAAKKL